MSTDVPRITLLPSVEPGRLFGRSEPEPSPARSYQAAVNQIALAIAAGTPSEEITHEIVVNASRALDVEIGIIRSVSSDGGNFVIASASGPAPLSIGGLLGSYSVINDDVRDCPPGEALLLDLRSDSDGARLPSNERWEFEHIGGRHLAIVPLHAGGELVGRLDLVRTTLAPFTPDTATLALPFATFAATVLRDRALHQASQERRVYQTVIRLHESVEQLADPETILQAVVELIVREPGADRCYALLWNSDRDEFVPTAVAGLDPNLVDILKLISLSPQVVPAFDQMVHSSRPLVIADATKSTLLPSSLVRALGIRAAMIVPLRSRRHQTSGVLLLDYADERRQFSDQQVGMMAQMAQHLSTLIENAILFEEIRSSSDSVSIINEIAIQLAMLTDEESIFRQLYHQVASVLDASRFAMGLLAPDRRALDLRIAVDGDVINGRRRISIGDDPLSSVALSGNIELQGNRGGSETREWLPGYLPDEPAHSHLTVPITVGRNVIGSLSIQSTFRNAYGPRDKDLLAAVALHTGIAIENARLYRLVQSRGDRRAAVLDQVMHRQEIERKELVNDIHDDTLQTLAACLYRLDQAQFAVERLGKEDPALSGIADVRDSLSENIARLRQRIFSLRPATLDRLGLEPALRELLNQIAHESELETDLRVELGARLVAEDETLVYRVVQEAIEHVRSRELVTSLSVEIQRHGDHALVAIHDNRQQADIAGIDDDDSSDLQLLALIERADLAGGHVRLSSRAAGGGLIQISLPVREREPASVAFRQPRPAARIPRIGRINDPADGDQHAGH